MPFFEILLLFATAVLAGALNAVAGGGTFFTFPALIYTGVDEISASATNSVVLWPGAIASTGGYRRELSTNRRLVLYLGGASLLGGWAGALLLLAFRDYQELFSFIVPYLMLIATLLFTFGSHLTKWVKQRVQLEQDTVSGRVVVTVLQFLISIYGGFFGGGMGVLMLAAYSVVGMDNIHVMNALKSLVSVLIKGIAVLTFAIYGAVVWPEAILMMVGAIIGGYAGASLGRLVDPKLMKRLVIVAAFLITIAFFIWG